MAAREVKDRSQYMRTTVRIPKELYIKVKALTLVEDTTFEVVLEKALERYIEKHREELEKVSEIVG